MCLFKIPIAGLLQNTDEFVEDYLALEAPKGMYKME